MAVKGRLKLNKQKPGANANDLLSSISALILNGVAVADKLVLATAYKITTPDALADFGIDAAYDTDNSCLVYYNLTDFFRMANPGTTLHFMVVAQGITPAVALEDTGSLYAKKLLLAANGTIRQLGFNYNPAVDTYTETLTDGFNSDIRAAIPKAKILRGWAADRAMPVDIMLEGRKYSGNSSTCADLRAITISGDIVSYEGVGVVIGQDYDFAETLWAMGKFHAAVGTALGTLASIRMEQDMGEVETLDITNVDLVKFVTAGLSNHTTIQASEAQLDTLDDKGYIFPVKYVNVTGHRWNGDHVCAPKIVDDQGVMNEHKFSYSRTVNESSRKLYDVYIPKVRTTHKVDATTGKLPLAKIKWFEAIGDDALAKVSGLSGGKTTVDPDSDLMRAPKQLNISFIVVPFGTVEKINGTTAVKTNL